MGKAAVKSAKKAAKSNEEILVIQRYAFQDVCGEIHGLRVTNRGEDELRELLASAKPTYVLRDPAETDTTLKQLIPYVVFRAGSEHGPVFFTYERTKKSGESRLHSKVSLGVGGHINPADGETTESFAAFQQAMFREIGEEVDINTSLVSQSYLGLLNDDSDTVGQVHLGVVYLIHLSMPMLQLRENAANNGQFRTLRQLIEIRDRLENWSQMVLDVLLKLR